MLYVGVEMDFVSEGLAVVDVVVDVGFEVFGHVFCGEEAVVLLVFWGGEHGAVGELSHADWGLRPEDVVDSFCGSVW